MKSRNHSYSALNLVARVLFPRTHRTLRRRELWFIAISLGIGLLVCVGFCVLLLWLNKQGHA